MHDINQLGETYLRMTFEAECKFSEGAPTSDHGTGKSGNADLSDVDVRFFLGWKNANECLKQLEVENMNIDTNYLQTECAKEGFAYSTYKPREEKMSRRYVHSRFGDVDQYKDGVCGAYFGACGKFDEKTKYLNMEGSTSDAKAFPKPEPLIIPISKDTKAIKGSNVVIHVCTASLAACNSATREDAARISYCLLTVIVGAVLK